MPRVLISKLEIENLGPIEKDTIELDPFTFLVGRNNAGKSHYLKAVELLLAPRDPSKGEIAKLQKDPTKKIMIKGYFRGVEEFTHLASTSNHREAIERSIRDGVLIVARTLNANEEGEEAAEFGIFSEDGSIHNPRGFRSNLLQVLPEAISIVATADTQEELKSKEASALTKVKKEVLKSFFEELAIKTKTTLEDLDDYLHGETGARSQSLIDFEQYLKEEFMGEFSSVVPSVRFELPNEEVIGKEMKIDLDDGHSSEIEQKGHGLQRATLLALLRVLAKYGKRYQDRPSPIFLIGELETFLHPYAQKLLAKALQELVDRYQILTSTHSPFIISPANISGYRRVIKNSSSGTKTRALDTAGLDIKKVQMHLEKRGNLEGLFADRIILIEGKHDEECFERMRKVFNIDYPKDKFTLFVKVDGKENLRQTLLFYKRMNFDDVVIICDLDYLFCEDFKRLLRDLSIDDTYSDELRAHLGITSGSMSLENILQGIGSLGEPPNLTTILTELSTKRVFTLKRGCPEKYFIHAPNEKDGWLTINSESDLNDVGELKQLITAIFI